MAWIARKHLPPFFNSIEGVSVLFSSSRKRDTLARNKKPDIAYLRWEIHNTGKEVAQFENSRASMAVGRRMMGDLRFSGYIYIFDEDDDDVVGVVFNYQNNKNFYLLTATRTDSNQVTSLDRS